MVKLIFGRASKSIRLQLGPAFLGLISSVLHITVDHIGIPLQPNVPYL